MRMKRKYGLFWAGVFSVHLFFFIWQVLTPDLHLVDSEEYITEAHNILTSGSFYCGDLTEPIRYDDFTKRPPVYPLLLAGVFGAGGGEWGMILLQNLLSLFNFFLLIRLGLATGLAEKHFHWMLPFIFLYPAQFIYANMIMAEIFFQTILLAMVFSAIRGIGEKSWFWLGIYTLLFMAGALTKPVLYLFIFPHTLVILVLIFKWRSHWGWIWILIPLLVWMGYMKANERRTGYFHFSSIQNLSLLQYTTYNLLIHTYGADSALTLADNILYRSLAQPDYASGQKLLEKECTAVIREHKWPFIQFHLKGMVNFFIDPGRFDLYSFAGIIPEGNNQGFLAAFSQDGYRGVVVYLKKQPLGIVLLLILVAFANLIKFAGILVFAFRRKIPVENRLVIVGLVFYIAGLTGSSGASRFAVPVFPLLLLTVPGIISAIISRLPISSKKKVY
ncbi:MAG: hypothetical protein SF052_01670 [Bacteroidia bacterium]|nr:hypothetical protein [Bacteroidia bacterium]